MKFQFIGIGDLHLESSSRTRKQSTYASPETISIVTGICAYALAHSVFNIFLYGDICDDSYLGYAPYMALKRIFRCSTKLQFHCIFGNHDSSLNNLRKICPNVHVYSKPTQVVIDGQRVNFLPWPSVDRSLDVLNVMHADVFNRDKNLPEHWCPESDAYTVSGHLHNNQQVRNTFYPGILYPALFWDRAPKFFHHGRKEKGKWRIDSVPVPSVLADDLSAYYADANYAYWGFYNDRPKQKPLDLRLREPQPLLPPLPKKPVDPERRIAAARKAGKASSLVRTIYKTPEAKSKANSLRGMLCRAKAKLKVEPTDPAHSLRVLDLEKRLVKLQHENKK